MIQIGPLDRVSINAIINSAGSFSDEFRRFVVTLAEGSPLIAHMACREAIKTGRYGWESAVDLMRETFTRRIEGIDGAWGNQHRAVATALAVQTIAQGGRDLSALASTITSLSNAPHELDNLLADLADAGVIGGPPYVIQPDLLSVAIVADALESSARIRIDRDRLVRVLGSLATGQPFQPSDTGGGIFGISPLFSQNVSTDYQLGRLRSQIYVLVQASLKSEDQALIATLATGVKRVST